MAVVVEGMDRGPESAGLHLAHMDGQGGAARQKRARDVRAAGDGRDPEIGADRVPEPCIGLGWQGEPVDTMSLMRLRSASSRGGTVPAFMQAM